MTQDKAKRLVERIIEKTMDGTLRWEATTDEGQFQAVVAGSTVRFGIAKAASGSTVMELRFYNEDGELVESLNDETFESGSLATREGSLYKRMQLAHQAARRQALGVDKIFDNILGELE